MPAILEWPAKFDSRTVDTPASTSDLYPTLVSITGAVITNQPKLDGIDLLPILEGRQKNRPPIGFWHGHTAGQATWSDRIIKRLKEAQESDEPNPFPQRLLKNVQKFPEFGGNALRGHAAWNAWPWKLHRIENKKGIVKFELYNLIDDPMEQNDMSDSESEKMKSMKRELKSWQRSVLESWSGKDYIDRK